MQFLEINLTWSVTCAIESLKQALELFHGQEIRFTRQFHLRTMSFDPGNDDYRYFVVRASFESRDSSKPITHNSINANLCVKWVNGDWVPGNSVVTMKDLAKNEVSFSFDLEKYAEPSRARLAVMDLNAENDEDTVVHFGFGLKDRITKPLWVKRRLL